MSLDHRLLHLLVCPVCKGPLEALHPAGQGATELVCRADQLAFPVRDGMPVMIEQEARSWSPDAPASACAAGEP